MHTFYPYYQKTFGTGGVDWLYQDPPDKRIGITIEKVEENLDAYKEKLYRIEVDWLRICPLFVFFGQAVNNKFMAEICNNADVQNRFCENYKGLAKSYDFEELTTSHGRSKTEAKSPR